MQTLRRWNPKGGGRTYYTTKVKDIVVIITTVSIERIVNLNPNPSKFPSSMLASKGQKLGLNKYVNPSKIKKSNQSYTTLYSDPRILYYILVIAIYPECPQRR